MEAKGHMEALGLEAQGRSAGSGLSSCIYRSLVLHLQNTLL